MLQLTNCFEQLVSVAFESAGGLGRVDKQALVDLHGLRPRSLLAIRGVAKCPQFTPFRFRDSPGSVGAIVFKEVAAVSKGIALLGLEADGECHRHGLGVKLNSVFRGNRSVTAEGYSPHRRYGGSSPFRNPHDPSVLRPQARRSISDRKV